MGSLCRVCLAHPKDAIMHCFGNFGLQEMFEKYTSSKLISEDGKPVTICFMCCSQLHKFNKFAELSHEAEKILCQLLQGLEVSNNM